MKRLFITAIASSFIIYADEAVDKIGTEVTNEAYSEHSGQVVQTSYDSQFTMWDNGPWYNSEGTGVGGADESILQSWGLAYGYGFQLSYDWRIADDFKIPTGELWSIEYIKFAVYQPGSGLTPTIHGMFLAVYDDNPNTGSIVEGDPYSNCFTSATWSNIYRVNESTSGTNTDRPIMEARSEYLDWWLTPGTYWLSMQCDGEAGSGPWQPPVVIWDQMNTGNGLQSQDGGVTWTPIDNGGYPQGFTFILYGQDFGGELNQATWGSVKTMF